MIMPAFPMTRRSALRLGLGLGAVALAPTAFAAPGVSFPMRIAIVRVSPGGFVQIRSDEQAPWTAMATRLSGIVAMAAPLQPGGLLGGGLPKIAGNASCALVARQAAADAGFRQLILYATDDGQRSRATYDNWFAETFSAMTAGFAKDARACGEALVLDVGGGPALASVTADAAPRDPLNLFDGGRNPERDVLSRLVSGVEQQLTAMARDAYDSQRSIAD